MPNSLPVIVGFGGYSAAGRSSSHQAFRRMVLESLPAQEQLDTVVGLACLMAQVTKARLKLISNFASRYSMAH
jgi:acetoacetyl-[acyl-carrier protein] synthase